MVIHSEGAQSVGTQLEHAVQQAGKRSPSVSLLDLWQLTKPNITLMSSIVAAGSMGIAFSGGAPLLWFENLMALLGIAASVSGASAFNMWLEKDTDGLMSRTKNRPLPAGRLESFWGIIIGAFWSVLSLGLLLRFANIQTAGLMIFALFAYVLVYTPMKRWSSWSIAVGSAPGAMPALMGYTALAGQIDMVGLSLFGVVFFWQLPHSFAITIYREKEYTAAGFVVAPSEVGLWATKVIMLVSTALMAGVSMMIWKLGVASIAYAGIAALLNIWLLGECAVGFRRESVAIKWARRVFVCTLIYQVVLFGALGADIISSSLGILI
jgi:heme o synthase